MPVATGVTEIADSEEEPLSSSPAAVSDPAVDKLSATARHDAQAAAISHQVPTEHSANDFSGRTDCLDVDHKTPSTDLSIASIDHLDKKVPQGPKTDSTSTCTTHVDATAGMPSLQASTDAIAVSQGGLDIGEPVADNASSTPADTDERASGLHERISAPADTHVQLDNAPEEHHPSNLRKYSSVIFTGTNTEQASPPRESLQGGASCNDLTVLASANSNLAHVVGNVHHNVEKHMTTKPLQNNTEPTDGTGSIESLSHDAGQQASVCLT